MNKLVKRQIRTTFLLLLSILLLVSGALYVRWCNSFEEIGTSDSATADDLAQAMKAYKQLTEADAAVLRTSAGASVGQRVELVFTGVPQAEETTKLISVLLKHRIPAVFYITAADAVNHRPSIELLLENDFEIGLLGSGSSERLDVINPEALTEQFCQSSMLLRSSYGIEVRTALTALQPQPDALRAAAANGIQEVLLSRNTLALSACTSEEACASVLASYTRGSILRLSISPEDVQTDVNLEHLLAALRETDLLASAQEKIAGLPIDQALTIPMQRVHTSEQAVCFTFAGLGNSNELAGVLAALKACDGQATFFVDYQELKDNEADVRLILDAGHALGLKATSDLIADAAQILYELTLAEEALHEHYSYQEPLLVRAEHGKPSDALLYAATAGGYTVVSNLLNPVQDSDVRASDAQTVLENVLPEGKRTLQRGEILHFRMNTYRNSDTLLGEVVTAFLTERSIYPLRPLLAVMNNEDACYTWPLPKDTLLPQVADRIHAGQLQEDVMSVFPARYIGTDWINSPRTLPGFTDAEIAQLDTAGLIPNDDNMVFLTFDDWGGDANLTHILDVLEKHNAKATFFIYTEHVTNNPNLLRAIAEAGHAVASHTHYHIPLSNAGDEPHLYVPLQPEQVSALKEDLLLSYQTMQDIIGDIQLDGRPALTPYFRPPTLALSREGVEAVYDAGYTWIISGSYSTDDYIATDTQALADYMLAGTCSGAVLVMHMTDSSVHTADALDLYLTRLSESGEGYKFAAITEALGLE